MFRSPLGYSWTWCGSALSSAPLCLIAPCTHPFKCDIGKHPLPNGSWVSGPTYFSTEALSVFRPSYACYLLLMFSIWFCPLEFDCVFMWLSLLSQLCVFLWILSPHRSREQSPPSSMLSNQIIKYNLKKNVFFNFTD